MATDSESSKGSAVNPSIIFTLLFVSWLAIVVLGALTIIGVIESLRPLVVAAFLYTLLLVGLLCRDW